MNRTIALCLILAALALVTGVQAPPYFTALDYVEALVAQCVEDRVCGSDTDCEQAERACVREITGGHNGR